jgi:hypothetical protein
VITRDGSYSCVRSAPGISTNWRKRSYTGNFVSGSSAEAKWSEDLAAARDCSASERIFTEASTKATVMSKRCEKLVETVQVRRKAAEAAWRTRREELIKERMHKSEQLVKEVRSAMASKPPDGFLVRVLNEEMRMVLFLRMGINGLAGVCPLS